MICLMLSHEVERSSRLAMKLYGKKAEMDENNLSRAA